MNSTMSNAEEHDEIVHELSNGSQIIIKKDRLTEGDEFIAKIVGHTDVKEAISFIATRNPRIRGITIRGCLVLPGDLIGMSELPRLRSITFAMCSIESGAFAQLKLPALETFSIYHSFLKEKGFEDFIGSSIGLLHLLVVNVDGFRGDSLRGFSLRPNENESKLEFLQISNCKDFNEENLQHLDGCNHLERLSLTETRTITNRVFEYASRIESLRSLGVDRTMVSDGLQPLLKLPNLQNLTLSETGFDTFEKLQPLLEYRGRKRLSVNCHDSLSPEECELFEEKLNERNRRMRSDDPESGNNDSR